MKRKRIAVISTGGTIEKTYDEVHGTLINRASVLDVMLNKLVLGGVETHRIALMNKDSLELTEQDYASIVACVGEQASATGDGSANDGIVVVHGTDRLTATGDRVYTAFPELRVPVVLTGAMRPFEVHTTDAIQNLTEALIAVQLVERGVYVAMHNRVLRFPGVVKDYDQSTFKYVDDSVGRGGL